MNITISEVISKVLIFILLTILVSGQDEESLLINELIMADLELQDDCENMANAMKISLIQNSFKETKDALNTHGQLLKHQSKNLKLFNNIPYEVQKNWTILVKSGDTLLLYEDWKTLVSYYIGTNELTHTTTVHCAGNQQKCPLIKRGYENILQSLRNETILKKSWGAWQALLTLRKSKFSSILNLIQKAAIENDQSDVRSYWEMLVEYENAYEIADALWSEIQPLYLKLQNFVKARIFRFYNIQSDSSEIPVYLLGSNFGYDWSHVADIVLPHPQIYYKANSYFSHKSIKDIYKLAEDLTEQMSLGKFGEDFWHNSLFNMTLCENRVLSFCSQEHSELLTCNKTSWVTYLNAFEVAIDVTLRNTDYLTLSRLNLRYHVIDEAIKSLGSVLAVKNMRHNGVVDNEFLFSTEMGNDSVKMTEFLLIALRVLPRLPFYLLADKWRLHLLENGLDRMEDTWWEFRKDIQGVEGIFNKEFDFLGDPYVMSNRPYLSKFLGTVLSFQLLINFQLGISDPNDNLAAYIGNDENFKNLIQNRLTDDWPNLISNYYSISYLSASPLLDYFQPLEKYLENAPLEQKTTIIEDPKITIPTIKSQKIQEKIPVSDLEENETLSQKQEGEDEEIHPKHIHPIVIDGPNPNMEKITMYVGLGLLGAVAAVFFFVVGSKKMRRKRNNRRLET